MHARSFSLILVALVGAAGCGFTASFDGTSYQCGEGGQCPSGYMCVGGSCMMGSSSSDSGAGDAPDAEVPTDGSVVPPGCGNIGLLRDDFASGTVGGYPWDLLQDPGSSVAETGGDLAITLGAGNQQGFGGYASDAAYDLTNSTIEVKVDAVGGHDTILEVKTTDDAKAQVVVEDGMLDAAVFGTDNDGDRTSINYDAATMSYWRIREASGRMYWEYSADRTQWTHLWDEVDPFPVTDVYALVTAGGQLASSSTARFADVNAQAAGGGFCATDSLHDSFVTDFTPSWNSWDDNGCSVHEQNGDLLMHFDGAETQCFAGVSTTHRYDLHGSSMVIDAKQIPVLAQFITYVDLQDPRDASQGTHLEAGLDYGDGTGTPQLFVDEKNNGATVLDAYPDWNDVAMRYWRFREQNDRLYVDTSPDAATWTNQLDAPEQIDLSFSQLVIGAGNYAQTDAADVKIGGINP